MKGREITGSVIMYDLLRRERTHIFDCAALIAGRRDSAFRHERGRELKFFRAKRETAGTLPGQDGRQYDGDTTMEEFLKHQQPEYIREQGR